MSAEAVPDKKLVMKTDHGTWVQVSGEVWGNELDLIGLGVFRTSEAVWAGKILQFIDSCFKKNAAAEKNFKAAEDLKESAKAAMSKAAKSKEEYEDLKYRIVQLEDINKRLERENKALKSFGKVTSALKSLEKEMGTIKELIKEMREA